MKTRRNWTLFGIDCARKNRVAGNWVGSVTQTRDLIAPDRLPLRAMRDAETYLKRRTFKLENATVVALLALYREAYRDMALILSSELRRTEAEARIAERQAQLRRDVLALVGAATATALLGGYYGKLWLLDVSTRADVRVNVQRIAAPPDEMLRAQLNVELDALGVDIRRVLVAGAAGAVLLSRLRRAMGADSTRSAARANFNRVQVLARTGIHSAANTGALMAMHGNEELVVGCEWLTARDERVCPICAPRDGKRYPLDTQERPPIHPQCRCTLVPLLDDGVTVAPDDRLRDTFAAWVRAIGALYEVSDFIG